MQDDTDMKNEMLFEVDSWRLDEYKAAVSDETFFRSTMDVFPVSTSSPRMTLLEEKHFIVGGNARLMFDVSTDTAMQTFDFAIQSASNIETYLNGYYGETSFDPTNQLLSRYYTKHNDDDVRILSRFVMRRLAMKLGPQFVTKFTQAFS
ncbi:hypothetical protein Poli38472_001286 [Pythium oligandrum]|uniref:Uncharacterized protein n=1 Tax=Pythium oligandrum TaxID=41045 RepID=A0A8K1CT65_PYTOL|nr:hypothetical protein Poli38472_001286 [Pythium oligandrum]|eukprot:TMW69130.1 hypothetical protein Poli38472_001286 [Pythium oligandrum]